MEKQVTSTPENGGRFWIPVFTCKHKRFDLAPSQDFDQPKHMPGLIRVFDVHLLESEGSKICSCP